MTSRVTSKAPCCETLKVYLFPNGVDDTAEIINAMQNQRMAVLGPVNAVFRWNPVAIAAAGLTWWDVELLEGVQIITTAGFNPGAGTASDDSNCIVDLRGTVVGGGGAYSQAVTLQVAKGTRSIQGIATTAGLAPGMALRLTATKRGGNDLQERQLLTVATVVDGTKITTVSPMAMWLGPYGQSSSNLPGTLTRVSPITHFRMVGAKGSGFDAQGKTIAVAIRLQDADFRAAGSVGLVGEGVGFKGFSYSAVWTQTVHGLRARGMHCAGGNNGLLYGASTHGAEVCETTCDPAGDVAAALGTPRPLFWFWEAPTDIFFDDNDIACRVGALHLQGGIAHTCGENVAHDMQPQARATRDALVAGLAFGVGYDGDAGPVNVAEFSEDIELGHFVCNDSYTNTIFGTAFVGPYAFYLHDAVNLNFDRLVAYNEGLDYTPGPIAGIQYWPSGGVFMQEWDNGHGESISLRNTPFGVTVNTGCPLSRVEYVEALGAQNTTSSSVDFLFTLNSPTPDQTPTFGHVLSSGSVNTVSAAFQAAPDYRWCIDRLRVVNVGDFSNVVYADAAANVSAMVATEVAELDATAPAGTRRVAAAGADADVPVVCAVGSEFSFPVAGKLVSLGGVNDVLVAGAAGCGDSLTADGAAVAANHGCRAHANNAGVTVRNNLGRALLSKGAGNALLRCER